MPHKGFNVRYVSKMSKKMVVSLEVLKLAENGLWMERDIQVRTYMIEQNFLRSPLLFLAILPLLFLFRSSPELSDLENPNNLSQPCFSLVSFRPPLLLDPVDPDGGLFSAASLLSLSLSLSLSSLLAAAAAALAPAEDVTLSPRSLSPVRPLPLPPPRLVLGLPLALLLPVPGLLLLL
jgi:hypothetical protein